MIRALLLTTALSISVTVVVAQGDPIAQRRETMKGVGAAARAGTQMIRGEAPFDPAKARQVLQTFANAAATMHTFFPETSRTGGDTAALPKIWEDMPAFRARFASWAADIQAVANQTDTLEEFRPAFTKVTQACGGCHETYRAKRN